MVADLCATGICAAPAHVDAVINLPYKKGTPSMLKTFGKLWHANLATPGGLFRLGAALAQCGVNLMALLRFAAHTYPGATAVVDENEELTYAGLLVQTKRLTTVLQERYKVAPRQ